MSRLKLFLRSGIISLVVFAMSIQTCMAAQGPVGRYKAVSGPVFAASPVSDTQPPSAPEGLTVTYKTYTSISLGWKRASDNIEVRGYQVYRDGRKIITTTKTSYTNTDLVPGREYTYTIKAYDAAGNVSAESNAVIAATAVDTQPPSAPGTPSLSSSSYTSITLNWKPSTDNTGIKGYEIYRDGVKKATTSATSYVCKGLIPGTTYAFTVRAYDIAGNYSMQSNSISAETTADTSSPSVPTSLKASSVTETEVSLTWIASSDNVKVKGYEVFCDGIKAGTTTKTSYTGKNLLPGTSYTYTIKAVDIVGNMSGSSNPLKVTALKDLQAPTAPTKLKVNSVKGSSVSLSWTASTDNIKVKGYFIYCNGIKIAATTRTSLSVKSWTGLGINTYWVKAYDLADNLSDSSNAVITVTGFK